MGEWSKKIGEYGENVAEKFFSAIGWSDLTKGVQLSCLNDSHLNKKGNKPETHGIDFLYSYMNPLVSGQLNNVIVSSKFSTSKYPNSATAQFKDYMSDLITTIECYDLSTEKNDIITGFKYSSENDIGILFWLNNDSESDDDLISKVSSARIDTERNCSIYILDNKRVGFILEVMKFIKTGSDKYNSSFYYPNTGQNINPMDRQNTGKILPVEFLNSSVIPIRLVNKDNPKEICLLIATIDNFEEEDLMRFIGFSKDITTDLIGEIIIAFPDYDELKHQQMVTSTKQKFQDSEITKTVSVINFKNPLSSF